MAEKVLKTKIQLRYDEFTNWTTNNPFLKKGEIAVTVIPAAATNTGDVIPPAIMFKVGSGEEGDASKFNSLPWASALAADVHPWAKAKTAPVIPTVGNGKITIKQNNTEKGSFTVNQSDPTTIELTDTPDTNTQYKLLLSGYKLTLQSKEKGETSWTDVQDVTLPDNNTTYTFTSTATSGASFKVTPSGGTAQTVYIDGLGTAAFKKVGDFATAAQGAKADSALQSHQSIKTLDTTSTKDLTPAASEAIAGSGTIKLHKVSKTGSYNDLLNKPTIPTIPNIEIADPSGSGNVITGLSASGHKITPTKGISVYTKSEVYTKNEVNGLVAGAVDYLGTVAKMSDVTALTPDSEGDFCRVSTGFTLTAASSGSNADVVLHAGDLLLCKALASGTTPVQWDVIHGEIDKNTWTKNSATADGYVTKTGGTSNAGKVWKVGTDGAPAWLADDNTNTSHSHTGKLGLICTGTGGTSGTVEYKAALKSETPNANAALAVSTANANRFYPVEVDKDGKLAVTVPWTDTKITDTNQKIEAGGTTFGDNAVIDIAGGTNITVTPGTNKITINGKSDDAINSLITTKINGLDVSNITGMGAGKTIKTLTETDGKINATFQDISIVASQISNLATAHPGVDKTGTVTKVSATVGSGLKITGDATKTPNIDWDDAVTLVFDCGDSTDPI